MAICPSCLCCVRSQHFHTFAQPGYPHIESIDVSELATADFRWSAYVGFAYLRASGIYRPVTKDAGLPSSVLVSRSTVELLDAADSPVVTASLELSPVHSLLVLETASERREFLGNGGVRAMRFTFLDGFAYANTERLADGNLVRFDNLNTIALDFNTAFSGWARFTFVSTTTADKNSGSLRIAVPAGESVNVQLHSLSMEYGGHVSFDVRHDSVDGLADPLRVEVYRYGYWHLLAILTDMSLATPSPIRYQVHLPSQSQILRIVGGGGNTGSQYLFFDEFFFTEHRAFNIVEDPDKVFARIAADVTEIASARITSEALNDEAYGTPTFSIAKGQGYHDNLCRYQLYGYSICGTAIRDIESDSVHFAQKITAEQFYLGVRLRGHDNTFIDPLGTGLSIFEMTFFSGDDETPFAPRIVLTQVLVHEAGDFARLGSVTLQWPQLVIPEGFDCKSWSLVLDTVDATIVASHRLADFYYPLPAQWQFDFS